MLSHYKKLIQNISHLKAGYSLGILIYSISLSSTSNAMSSGILDSRKGMLFPNVPLILNFCPTFFVNSPDNIKHLMTTVYFLVSKF